jgi:filamentous hemagglutinin
MNGLGYGSDGGSDSSVTRAGITGVAGNSKITTDNRDECAGSTRKILCPCRCNIWTKH